MEPGELRSRAWTTADAPRYWWHRLRGMDYVPPIYSDLSDNEWSVIRAWYDETDRDGHIGEAAVPLLSFLHGVVLGNRGSRIVQLGTHAGYSTLLLGFMLRRMGAERGLFTLDIDPAMCGIARSWTDRAGLQPYVNVAEGDSLAPDSERSAREYLGSAPELIILDSSHEYAATLRELDLWYPALAPGGLLVLHDVSSFAESFDVTGTGGVRRAFDEWRSGHCEVETFLLNGEARSMDEPRPLYKDACGLGLIHKPSQSAAST
jgi:predicted O-methyltransferase YrrM